MELNATVQAYKYEKLNKISLNKIKNILILE